MKILILCALCVVCGFAVAAEKPNILIIVSDDHGYADAGFQGGKEAVTPHLDALAKSGVRCTSGYVTYPVCSPSRAGLMTGRYQARFGHENNPVYDPLDANEGLPLKEKLLPQFLKGAGYRTGWIGKWHLGSSPAHVPWARGFDESFGFIGGGHRFTGWQPDERQYTLPLIRSGVNISNVPPHLTTALGDEAAGFIHRNKAQPWMLYLPFNAPHTPHEPSVERLEKFAHIANPQRRKYLAQVSLLDDAIGAVTAALAVTGQRERTLIFFFSDNGGHTPSGSDNDPLYLICRSGSRGQQACEKFVKAGYSNAVNIEGGTIACVEAGLPVIRGKKSMSLERQVRIAAGSLVLLGAVLGWFVHPAFIGLSAFVGAGLVFSGITGTCGMAMILARMPWNR